MTPPRRRIFLICGYAGAGKDTVGRHLVATRACVRYAFADGVREVATLFGDRYNVHRNDDDDYDYNVPYKEALTQCGGYEAVKRDPLFKDGVRDYLVKIGHGLREVLGKDIWVRRVIWEIEKADAGNDVVITDGRYCDELARLWMEYEYAVWAIWVERDGVGPANETEDEFTTPLRSMCNFYQN